MFEGIADFIAKQIWLTVALFAAFVFTRIISMYWRFIYKIFGWDTTDLDIDEGKDIDEKDH